MKIIAGLIAIFLTVPIWLFLLYRILIAINANELTWFLYWVYVPATIIMQTIVHLTKDD